MTSSKQSNSSAFEKVHVRKGPNPDKATPSKAFLKYQYSYQIISACTVVVHSLLGDSIWQENDIENRTDAIMPRHIMLICQVPRRKSCIELLTIHSHDPATRVHDLNAAAAARKRIKSVHYPIGNINHLPSSPHPRHVVKYYNFFF